MGELFEKEEFVEKLRQHIWLFWLSSRKADSDYESICKLLRKEQITDVFIIETLRRIIYAFGDDWDADEASRFFWDSVVDEIGDPANPDEKDAMLAVTGWAKEDGKIVFVSIISILGLAECDRGGRQVLGRTSSGSLHIGMNCLRCDMTKWNLRALMFLQAYQVSGELVKLAFERYKTINVLATHQEIINFINRRLPIEQAKAIIHQIDVDAACFVEGREPMELTPGEKAIIDCGIRNLTRLSDLIECIV